MRRLYLIAAVPLVLACSRGEEMPADSAAAASPAVLTEADVAGTWTGTATNEAPDTGSVAFTVICGTGTCKFTAAAAPNDTVLSTYTIAADSAHGVSSAYPDPQRGGAMVVDHWISRKSDANSFTGHGWVVLADKPDSVVTRYRMTGTRQP